MKTLGHQVMLRKGWCGLEEGIHRKDMQYLQEHRRYLASATCACTVRGTGHTPLNSNWITALGAKSELTQAGTTVIVAMGMALVLRQDSRFGVLSQAR